ncbi:HNH endonuclease signature motif containing protein [Rhodococcus oryzae]|uniref:HNH endonuclease signature motif containing protein n=1 Tax=Rhodococcus oryzae TaxID=2571143 RepID=UPI003795412A
MPPNPPAPTSIGTITDAILAAIDADPTLARAQHPDGHGGLTAPPDGALTYRPDATTTALVHARDGHCRFPGCTRPAAGCQLDHIVEYRAHDPIAGGWTIATNLHCLCQFHHQLKTLGLWTVTALPGHAMLWTSRTGTTALALPAGAHGSHTLHTPAPRITGRRGHTPPPRPATPQDPPPF